MRRLRQPVAPRCSLLIGQALLTFGARDRTLLTCKILLKIHPDVSAQILNPRRTIWACSPQSSIYLQRIDLNRNHAAAHLPEARVQVKGNNNLSLSIGCSLTSHRAMALSFTGLLSTVRWELKISIPTIALPSILRLRRQRTNNFLRNALLK